MVDYNSIHFIRDGTTTPLLPPLRRFRRQLPQGGADCKAWLIQKKYAIRRGDHRSPENRIHFVRNGTPSPFLPLPSDGSPPSALKWEPIVSVADTKNMQFARGDHRSPKNRIHFVGGQCLGVLFCRHSVTSCHLSSRRGFLRRPLEGSCRETTEGCRTTI